MKNLFTALLAMVLCVPGIAQTAFVPGDILVTAANCNIGGGGQWDEVAFFSCKNIVAGDYLDFTDNGYERATAGVWGDLEGAFRLTRKAGASTVTAGTSIAIQTAATTATYKVYTCGVLDNNWTVTNLNGAVMFDLGSSDCFWVLHGGTWTNPAGNNNATYSGKGLYGYSPTTWATTAGYNNNDGSTIFNNLDCVNIAVTVANSSSDKRTKYSGLITPATQDVWIGRVSNAANWSVYGNNNSYYAFRDYLTVCISNVILPSGAGTSILGTWTGNKDQNWFDCANWSGKQVPDTTINVVIPFTAINKPVIDGSLANATKYQKRGMCNNLNLQSNSKPLEIKYVAANNTGSLLVKGNITFEANVLDLPGGKLSTDDGVTNTADGTIVLRGNWVNNAGAAQYVKGEGTVAFNGTAQQSISGTGTQAFYKLELKNSAGLLLQTNIQAGQNLKMSSGNIITGANTLQLGTSAVQKGTLTHTSGYVYGTMSRWFSGTNSGDSTSLFPLSNSTYQNRFATVSYTTAATTAGKLTARFVEADPGDAGMPIPQANAFGFDRAVYYTSPEGYWQIDNDPSTLTNGLYTLSLTGEGFGGIVSLNDVTLIKRHTAVSPNWYTEGVHQANHGSIGAPVVTRTGMSNWSNFNIGHGLLSTPLPVELIYFTAIRTEKDVQLSWATAMEINSDYFAVERSTNGVDFEETGIVSAANFSTSQLLYSFTDNNTSAQVTYYRLRMVDLDGTTEYSNMVAVESGQPAISFHLFPNPAKDVLVVNNVSADEAIISISNISGTEIHRSVLAQNQTDPINVAHLPAGVYFAVIITSAGKQSVKWVKQ